MRVEKFHYYLLDEYDQPKSTGIGDTNELFNVISGDITYNSLGRLKSSLTLKIKDSERLNINYNKDRVQLVIEIDGIKYTKGIYLISTSSRSSSHSMSTRFLTCYSKLKILDRDKVLSPYYLPKGANIYTAIVNLIGNNPINITTTDKTLNADYTAATGTPKLDIINDLLDILNYNSLHVNDNGVFTSCPYVLPASRDTEIYYIEEGIQTDNNKNVCKLISSNFDEDADMFDVPNIFLRYTSNVDIDPPITAIYPIQNDPNNPTTIDGLAPNVSSDGVDDIADYATLYAKCKKDAAEARNIYSHLNISSAINPSHGYLNCVEIKVMDINYKYIETEWSMNLKAGALMKHTLRRVINLED